MDVTQEIKALIEDEREAVAGYQRALTKFKGNVDSKIIKRLEEIRDDEIEHIDELKALLKPDDTVEEPESFYEW